MGPLPSVTFKLEECQRLGSWQGVPRIRLVRCFHRLTQISHTRRRYPRYPSGTVSNYVADPCLFMCGPQPAYIID